MDKDLKVFRRDVPVNYLFSGTAFIFLWILSQFVPTTKVFLFMDMAVEYWDSGYLLAAAVVLVLINSTRAISLYLGWFLLGEGFAMFMSGRSFLSWGIPLIAIPMSYGFVSSMGRGIVPHFGIPAVLSVASVLILHFMTRQVSGWLNKTLALALFIFSFQWFDVTPFLTPYGAGWGELSMSIKGIALLMEREVVLNISGLTLFSSLFIGGIITSELLVAYSSQLNNMFLLRENEKKLTLLREENIRNRGAVELQQLVHDLKRPLTTITGLTDVILSLEDMGQIMRHTSVIAKASVNMNDMISEILHARSRRNVQVSELVGYTLNQISPMDWKDQVRVDAEKDVLQTGISINLIRFSRAVVNLLDNAHRAVADRALPLICINLSREGRHVLIRVTDNGPGFSHDGPVENVSGWSSTGIGLGYVRQVVEDNGGTMVIGNGPDGGGEVKLSLPVPDDR